MYSCVFRMSIGQNREVFITVRVEESDYFRREGTTCTPRPASVSARPCWGASSV